MGYVHASVRQIVVQAALIALMGLASFARADTLSWQMVDVANDPSTAPPVDGFTTMYYDSGRGRTIALAAGGAGTDIWEWDGTTWTPVTATNPGLHRGPAVYDAKRARGLVLGVPAGSGFGILTEWDAATSTWINLQVSDGVAASSTESLGYDPMRDRFVGFGGVDGNGNPSALTTEVDLTSGPVAAIPPNHPSGREYSMMVYDAARAHLLLFGGDRFVQGNAPCYTTTYSYLNDSYAYDGTTWTSLSTPDIPIREDADLVFDSKRSRVIMWGGALQPASCDIGVCGNTCVAGTPANDMWAHDGTFWSEVDQGPTVPPSDYSAAAMAYDSNRDRIVLLLANASGPTTTWEYGDFTPNGSDGGTGGGGSGNAGGGGCSATPGNGGTAGSTLLLIAVLAIAGRRQRRR